MWEHWRKGESLQHIAHRLRDVARRPVAEEAVERSYEFRYAVFRDLDRRHPFRSGRGRGSAQCADRTHQYRKAYSLISVAVIIPRKTRPDLPRAFCWPAVPPVPLLAIRSASR